jgi:DnaJ-class molecular chaperone
MKIDMDCPTCGGTGLDQWMRQPHPGTKLLPVPCQDCTGTGRKPKPVPIVSKMQQVRRTRKGG